MLPSVVKAKEYATLLIENMTFIGLENFIKLGGAVAEWSKALLEREKINENQKNHGLGYL